MHTIPFNRPMVGDNIHQYLREAVANMHLSGDGPFTRRCHHWLEQQFSVPKALLTTSCTHDLEMAGLLLDIAPGDEVIVPSFTFVSTVNAFVLRGARPVFCDIRPDTLNIDEKLLPRLITKRTKAIIPVHYAGISCEMDSILSIADGIPIVEDNAHGMMGSYRGKPLGTFGALSTLSFHETKNFSCGEGGALLVVDPRFSERAEIIREKGTNRSKFFRGQVDKYTWVDLGSSYLPSDALAALLLAQLERADQIQARRKHIWESYQQGLGDWAHDQRIQLPTVPPHCGQAYHLFYLVLPSLESRQAIIAHLKSQNIHALFHYLPLHLSVQGRKFGGKPGDCPVTEWVSDRLVRLPLYFDLTDDDVQRVIETVCDFRVGSHGVRIAA
jgi:dTDP-4-amino-4,6-dideoxygalactose transaminase